MARILLLLFTAALLSGGCAGARSARHAPPSVIPEDACMAEERRDWGKEPRSALKARRKRALEILAEMTTGEKVGQLFITKISGAASTSVNGHLLQTLRSFNPGGVVFYGANVLDDGQVSGFIEELQSASKWPLFISVDEEGGVVSRLGANSGVSVTKLPPMSEIGQSASPRKAFETGESLGREMRALGFNLNFAPVADVLTNPSRHAPYGAGRAFGETADVVCAMAPWFVRGLQGENVSATLKHFPGHGGTAEDSHLGRVYYTADLESLRALELRPFRAGINAGADFVMTAHISLPALTGDDAPATMSREIITGLLKEELGFEGIIISDDMNMAAITRHYPAAEAAEAFIMAGGDMFIFTSFFEAVYGRLMEAVSAGRVPESRIDESALKIIELKIKRGIME
jgi:beta-N-acetylhexosaminidase